MKISFLEVAQQELDEAIIYYNNESNGLGTDFLDEVLKALDRIARHPHAWHPSSIRSRRCLLRRFPYGVIYQSLDNEILVIAVANLHRKPNYWQDRVK